MWHEMETNRVTVFIVTVPALGTNVSRAEKRDEAVRVGTREGRVLPRLDLESQTDNR